MNDKEAVSLKEYIGLKTDSIKESVESLRGFVEMKTKHIEEVVELRAKLSETAISKSEETITERQEVANGKYELMREQTQTFARTFATKDDIKAIDDKVALLTKLVYIGMGGLIVLEFVFRFFTK